MPPPPSTAVSCSWSPVTTTLQPLSWARARMAAMSGSDIMLASSRISSEPRLTGSGPRASRWPWRWPRNRAVLYAWVTPASARTLRAVCEVVRPITSPRPAWRQILALLAVADALPVTVLAVIAGAGSFTHIRDTAAQHGQGGPMSWAVAVCIDLTCVMAARERQRDKQQGVVTRRLSWPTAVLAGGILLSLAANLARAQPTAWGRIVAAVPPAAFLVAGSMFERLADQERV